MQIPQVKKRLIVTLFNFFIYALLEQYHRADLLHLSHGQSFHPNLKQFYLDSFPLPAFLLFTVVEFDFLHAGDELNDTALFFSGLGKISVIQLAAIPHKREYPYNITDKKNAKNS